MILSRLRNQNKVWASTVLALFIASCLNLGVESSLWAATPDECHESAMQPSFADSLRSDSVDFGADCAHCLAGAADIDDPANASFYICAAMASCGDDIRQPVIGTAGLKIKPGPSFNSNGAQLSAASADPGHFIQAADHPPPFSLNIQYCRFLI